MVQPKLEAEELHLTTDRSSSSRMTMESALAGKKDGLRTERRPIAERRPPAKSGSGCSEDSFVVYDGTASDPMSNAAIWRYVAKNGLKPPDVPAVEEFKKIFNETEKQQQQQQKKP